MYILVHHLDYYLNGGYFMETIVKFLKAIYLVAIATALILIGGVISGGQYSVVPSFLFVLGVILLLIGVVFGIAAFSNDKEEKK